MTTNLGRMFGKILGCALVAGGLFAWAPKADAAVQVDLRFADNTKDKLAAPGDYLINVWMQVTGIDPAKSDGIEAVFGAAQSVQVNGGTVVGGAGTGITANTFQNIFSNGSGGPNGFSAAAVATNTTADGIQDWGVGGNVNSTAIKYNTNVGGSGVTPAYGFSSGTVSATPGVVVNAIANGTEYLVGTLTFHLDTLNLTPQVGAVTQVNWVNGVGSIVKAQTTFPDEVLSTAAASYTAPTSGVTFSIPEPASLALLGLGALAFVARPRRKA